MERSENEIVAAPPFSTVQVKPPRFFARMVSSPFSRNTPFQLPTIRFSAFAAMLLWEQAAVGKSHGDKQKCEHGNEENSLLFLRLFAAGGDGSFLCGGDLRRCGICFRRGRFNFFAAVHTEDSVFRDRAAVFGTKHKIFLSLRRNMWKTRHRSLPLERV